MAASVFQPTCDGESVVEQLDLWNVSPGTLSDVPSTCIKLNECNIAGSPNPRTSPCYRSYKVGLHADHFESALVNDTAWTISRHFNRSSQSTDSQDVNQLVPVWSAYNCLVNTPESGQQSPTIAGKAYALPIINAPAHEWSPLYSPRWINCLWSTDWYQRKTASWLSRLIWTYTSEYWSWSILILNTRISG